MAKKKKISSWKQKRKYVIQAPENFDGKELGTTVASDPSNLHGRTVDTSLNNLTDDRSKQHFKIVFEVDNVKEDKASTQFKKFYINPGYLRSKVRKGTNKIKYVQSMKLKDDKVKIKIDVLSQVRFNTQQRKDISSKITGMLKTHESSNLNQLVQHTLFGKLGTEIYKEIKKICPVNRVEVVGLTRL